MTDEAKAVAKRLRQVSSVLFDDYGDGTHAVEDYALAGKAADLIETQAREIERLERLVKYWTARAALGDSHD